MCVVCVISLLPVDHYCFRRLLTDGSHVFLTGSPTEITWQREEGVQVSQAHTMYTTIDIYMISLNHASSSDVIETESRSKFSGYNKDLANYQIKKLFGKK